MGEAVGSLSGLLEKTDRGWMLVCHSLDKALKDTQHTVFLIQGFFFSTSLATCHQHVVSNSCRSC